MHRGPIPSNLDEVEGMRRMRAAAAVLFVAGAQVLLGQDAGACGAAWGATCVTLAARPPAGPAQTQELGFLDVTSDPPAKVVVDGNETGKTCTPTRPAHIELPVGHHKLKLVTLDGARQYNIGFVINKGQTTKLTIHMQS
jgi:hypothetical protein